MWSNPLFSWSCRLHADCIPGQRVLVSGSPTLSSASPALQSLRFLQHLGRASFSSSAKVPTSPRSSGPPTLLSTSPAPPGIPTSPRPSCLWRHLQGLQHLCRLSSSPSDSPSRASRISKQVPLSRHPLSDSPLSQFCCW